LLTAMVPGSMILMTASTLLAKNVYRAFVPSVDENHVAKVAKGLVPVVALISLYFTFQGGNTIVTLLLMGYSLVTQLFPALLFSLMRGKIVTKQGAAAGIVAGVATVTLITMTNTTLDTLFPEFPQAVKDLNVGIVALVVNVAVMILVSLATRRFSLSGREDLPATTNADVNQ
ncbi:MAG: sodium:solute symporter family protein, partial [Calditerricola sp.]|nr:sodium:solute symporter family protein [Calditerricola sp.]